MLKKRKKACFAEVHQIFEPSTMRNGHTLIIPLLTETTENSRQFKVFFQNISNSKYSIVELYIFEEKKQTHMANSLLFKKEKPLNQSAFLQRHTI